MGVAKDWQEKETMGVVGLEEEKDQQFHFEHINLLQWHAITLTLQSQFIFLIIHLFVD